jgi:hypothetical protein
MQRRIFAGLFLFYLFTVAGGGAQSLADSEKPVWTMEILKVLPGQFGPTLGYLDDNWMRVREKAKRQGAVLSYHRIAEGSDPEGEYCVADGVQKSGHLRCAGSALRIDSQSAARAEFTAALSASAQRPL